MKADSKAIVHAVQTVRRLFPDDADKIVIYGKGEDFLSIDIRNEWIFLFPKNPRAVEALGVEIRLLPAIAKRVPLPIPYIEYARSDFIGYRKIHGVRLASDVIRSWDSVTRFRCAKQLGEFLGRLHTFPPEEAREAGVSDSSAAWRFQAYRNVCEYVLPSLKKRVVQNVVGFFDRYHAMPWESLLIHGDLSFEDHVFFNPTKKEIAGIIDFGDIALDDPAHDFQCVLEDGGVEFFHLVSSFYTGKLDPLLGEKTQLRIRARPLFDAGWVYETHQEERFKIRVEEIDRLFEKPYTPFQV